LTKYDVTIVKIGDLVKEFLNREKLLVLYDEMAPMELHDISVIHTKGQLNTDVEIGDRLYIDKKEFEVTAIGSLANKNIKEIGHVCLKFDGMKTPELPGYIHVNGDEINDISIGLKIQIKNKSGETVEC